MGAPWYTTRGCSVVYYKDGCEPLCYEEGACYQRPSTIGQEAGERSDDEGLTQEGHTQLYKEWGERSYCVTSRSNEAGSGRRMIRGQSNNEGQADDEGVSIVEQGGYWNECGWGILPSLSSSPSPFLRLICRGQL